MKLFILLICVSFLVIAQEPDALGLTEVKPSKLNTSQFKPVTILGVHPNNHNGNYSGKDRHTGFAITPHIVSLDEIQRINSAGANDPIVSGQRQVVTSGQPFRSSITTPPVAVAPIPNTPVAPAPAAPVAPAPAAPVAPAPAAPLAPAPTAPAPAAPIAPAPAAPIAPAPAAPIAPAPASNSSLIPVEDQAQVTKALADLKTFLDARIAKLPADKQAVARAKATQLSAKVKTVIMEKLGNVTLSDGTEEEHKQAAHIIAQVKNNLEAAGGLLMSSVEKLVKQEVSVNATATNATTGAQPAAAAASKADTKATTGAQPAAAAASKEEVAKKPASKEEVAKSVESSIEKAMTERDQTNTLAQKVADKAMHKVEEELKKEISGLPGADKKQVIADILESQKEDIKLKLVSVKSAEEAQGIIAAAVASGKKKADAEASALKETKEQSYDLARKTIKETTEKLKEDLETLPEDEKAIAKAKIDAREETEVEKLATKLATADNAAEAKQLISEEKAVVKKKVQARIEIEKKRAEQQEKLQELVAEVANVTALNKTAVDGEEATKVAEKAVEEVKEQLDTKISKLPESEKAVAEEEAAKVVAQAEKKVEGKLKTGEVDAANYAAVQELAKSTTKTAMKREARREAAKEEVEEAKKSAAKSEEVAEKATVALEKLEAKEEKMEAKLDAIETPTTDGNATVGGNTTVGGNVSAGAPATGLLKKLEAKIEKLSAKETKEEEKEQKEETNEKEKSGALRDAHNGLVGDLKDKIEQLQNATKDMTALKERVTNIAANQTSDHELLLKLQQSVEKLSKVEVANAEAVEKVAAKE